MYKKIIVIALALFLFGSNFTVAKTNNEYAVEYYNLAIDMYNSNKTAKSIKLFNKAIDLYPEFYEAHYNIAQIYMSLGRYDEALKHLEAIYKLRPKDSENLYNLGKANYQKGNLSNAYYYLKKIDKSMPQYDFAKTLIGLIEEHNHNMASNDKKNINSSIKSINTSSELNKGTVSSSQYFKKDPKLIVIDFVKPVSSELYNRKKISDDKIYANKYKGLSDEQKQIYLILERLIRANKLYYQNWRIGIGIAQEEVNAYATSANLIKINSSLYDSIYKNNDALAFVIAHELAHLILNHNQISYENNYKINQLQQRIQELNAQFEKNDTIASVNNAVGNYYGALGNSVANIFNGIGIDSANSEINKIYESERQLEINADIEAITLMARAGFDINKSYDCLDFLSRIPNIHTNRSSHPDITLRKENISYEIATIDRDKLISEGKNNIYNSNVLAVKKSIDNNSIIIEGGNISKIEYIPESRESKTLKTAYKAYLNNDMQTAKHYFHNVKSLNYKNSIASLYLSYIFEYEYLNYTHNKKTLKIAKNWAGNAKAFMHNDYIEKQINDINALFSELKNKKIKKWFIIGHLFYNFKYTNFDNTYCIFLL